MTNEREANDEERVTKKGKCGDGKMNLQGEISKIGKDYFGKVPYLCHRNSK
ncbi:hypothetical protein HMPREF9078_00808 [Capnocytophaga sp. oral taxon 380 str. F0488]|nr:hypothetical protein HMPREF9078_00808 [Capnocytophaga sp. oral taxon 380 str. F0488]